MRIVTYNVNGLRARLVPPRTLLSFLDSLNSDIICFQETKASRQELTADIAVAEGYESFFSCTRTVTKGRIGYSGVATFCRVGTAVPLAADEGFTGLLHCGRTGEIEGGKVRVGCYDRVLSMEDLSRQELMQLDSEGRCLVTDHGSFVLFNFYGPRVACGDEDRLQFKVNFYRALQHRWEELLQQGRRIIAVGDYNISPFPIDSCDPGPDFDSSITRQWLQSMLRSGGGPFSDVFRVIHANRKEAYTCWSQASGAEEFNYGTRIDLILVAGPCLHQSNDLPVEIQGNHSFADCEVVECDILEEFKRFKPDSLPRWVGGRNIKLEGSDHAPVFAKLKEQPPLKPHEVPPLAARFMPELRGRQQSIVSLLHKRPFNDQIDETDLSQKPKNARLQVLSRVANVKKSGSKTVKRLEGQKGKQQNLRSFFTLTSAKQKNGTEELPAILLCSQDSCSETFVQNSQQELSPGLVSTSSEAVETLSQVNVFKLGDGGTSADNTDHSLFSSSQRSTQSRKQGRSERAGDESSSERWPLDSRIGDVGDLVSGKQLLKRPNLEATQKSSAATEWQRIQRAMVKKVPLCKGHGDPCVVRVVKKAGPNFGRAFHVCARAQGPSSNPEARCNHFEWNSSSKAGTKK